MNYEIAKDKNYEEYEKLIRQCSPDGVRLSERAIKLFRELNSLWTKECFDILLLLILQKMRLPFLLQFQQEECIIDKLEAFNKSGHLEQVMEVAGFFVACQKQMYEMAKKNRIEHAWSKKRMSNVKCCIALEPYLRQVEFIWHPQEKGGCEKSSGMKRNVRTNKESALKQVYRDHSAEIDAKLKDCGFEGDCEKKFSNCFRTYTRAYVENITPGQTCSGHVCEKRAPRTDASRERSRKAAKSKWTDRRKK